MLLFYDIQQGYYMSKIKQLSAHEAQKIAAGEVVERPANVVKELLENALDAGATEISLHIEDGGKKLIQIVDNGYGMSKEDAHMSIKHHATSKITSVNDLEQVRTFGFRGEALSSIAAVSKMVLRTKEAEQEAGIALEIAESKVLKESIVASNTGTDIAIHDLFYNVPARKKFLKTKETEWRAIVQLFHAVCLSSQKVAFKLYHENRPIYTLPASSSLQERIKILFEPGLSKQSLSIEGREERMNLQVEGVISAPSYTRYDRSHIYVFVNNRWVKNHKLAQALIRGYQQMLQPNRYPAGFLHITLDTASVDINIHPRKEEVQFLHPRIIEELIQDAVQQALTKHQDKQLGATLFKDLPAPKQPMVEEPRTPKPLQPTIFEKRPITSPVEPVSEPKDEAAFAQVLASAFEEKPVPEKLVEPSLQYRLIGQCKLTYVIIETNEGMVFVDQHAAHERVIYERIKNNFQESAQIRLLFPQVITLSKQDKELFEPYIELLGTFGVEAQSMGEHELMITQTPVFLKNQSLDDCIKKAISALHEYQYLEKGELKKIIQERLHAQISCKAAIRAGDSLTSESMHSLIKDLYKTENKLTCPHGRPTIWQLTLPELEKKFKRDYR